MPKFFRNIRIKSIELIKVKNYLLYAVGEIILVTIGILLALQVSNWNEERNKEELRQGYYKSLLYDLTRDTAQIQRRTQIWQNELLDFDSLKIYSQKQTHFDSLLVKTFKLSKFYLLGGFNDQTYQTLLSSSDIKLMNDSVSYLLKELARAQVFYSTNELANLDFIKAYAIEEGKLHYMQNFSSLAGETERELNQGVDKRQILLLRDKHLAWKITLYQESIDMSSKIKSIEIKLIKLIKQLQKK